MNVLKTTKMNSNILVSVLLAYFLDNLSGATIQPVKSISSNGKSTSVSVLPTKSLQSVFGDSKVNSKVSASPPSSRLVPPAPPALLSPRLPPPTLLSSRLTPPVPLPLRLPPPAPLLPRLPPPAPLLPRLPPPAPLSPRPTPSAPTSSRPTPSAPTSLPILKKENDNHQESDVVKKINHSKENYEENDDDEDDEGDNDEGDNDEGDDYEEDDDEDERDHYELDDKDHKEYPKISKTMKQENDNDQGSDIHKVEDDYNVSEGNEDSHNAGDKKIVITGLRINMPSGTDELTENNYNESDYSFISDEDDEEYDNKWESESSYINNKSTDISEALNRKNDNTKDQAINTNDFKLNPYDKTQIPTDKQEEYIEDLYKNQYVSKNKERIINESIKKILYMLHDYASSTFNWIINKINYRLEQLSS